LNVQILADGDQKPQSKQLQTRVEYLLKFMQKLIAAQRIQAEASKPRIKKPKALKPKTDGNSTVKQNSNHSKGNDKNNVKEKHKKDKKKTKSKDKKRDKEHKREKHKKKKDLDANSSKETTGVLGDDLNDDLDPKVFEECKERMRPVKKALKALDKPDASLSKSEQKSHYMQHLRTIGVRIDECLQEFSSDPTKSKEWRNHLWTFVSKFTEYHAKKLYKLYKHSLKSEHKGSEESHTSRRDRHDRHHTKQQSSHSSFNPLKRESSSSGFPINKIMKKEREDYNEFDPKANNVYSSGLNMSQTSGYRNSWPKHDGSNTSMRPMPYERDRGDHYPKYVRDETDRKHRYPNERRYNSQNVSQGQHSGSYGNHTQAVQHSGAPLGPNRSHSQYDQHYFPHSNAGAPINQSNQYQSSWSSFNNPREPPYHRNPHPVDSYRRPFTHNSDDKPSLSR
jgi:hypothetical protein